MKWEQFLRQTESFSVVDAETLLVGVENPQSLRVQLSRWQKSGKLIQLRRGIYVVNEIYRKKRIFEPFLAFLLKKPSYISLEKALEYHGLIPEGVPVYTSVTPKRPERISTPLGIFDYRHIKRTLFWGYSSVTVDRQTGYMALPEKALLDLLYIKKAPRSEGYLFEMRLQNLDVLDTKRLIQFASQFQKPGILAHAEAIAQLALSETEERIE